MIFAACRGLWDFTCELIEIAGLGEELFQLYRAVEYLQTGDKTLLEKLSPEIKEVVQVFIDDIDQIKRSSNQTNKYWLDAASIWEFDDYVSKRPNQLYRVLGVDSVSKRNAWWVVFVFPDKEQEFSRVIKDGNLRLTDYGLILESGFGEKLTDGALKRYGFKD